MSLQYTTSDGQTLIVPGAYAQAQVVAAPSSVAANGILMVLGEADSGPSYAEESDITLNVFGPDQKADIVAKYGSGALVDAYVGAVTASKDDNIKGSFTRFIPIKTNMSVKSSTTLPAVGGGTYANLFAKSAGKPGNLITRTIKVNLLEQVPVIGPLLLASPQVVTDLTSRVNGGAGISIGGSHLAVGATPTAMVSAMAALTGTTTSGGVARVMIDTTRSVTTSNVVGFSVTFTATTNFAHSPVVGDILFIPTGSQFATANEGTYVVQSAGSNIFTALKVIDAAGTGFSRTAPTIETVAAAAAADIESFSPVTISVTAGAVVPGLGKSLELANNSLVAGLFSDLLWAYNPSTLSVSRYGVVSTSAVPFVITSPQEYQVDLNVVRQKDGISEDIVAGGSPVLSFGYVGTTASAVVANGTMVLTLAGGVSSSLSPITITLSDFPTIGDLCQYLNSLGGFTASPTLATYSSISPTLLDAGTYSFATTWGAQTGRIKTDGSDFLSAVNAQSVLVNISPAGIATNLVGLPDIVSLGFLSGGSRGASSNASIQGGLDILQAVKGNLVIPLFSNDSGIDIASGFTDPTSVYDIKSINSAVRAHCLQMSQLKRRRRRLAVLSNRDTFSNDKINSSNIASSRCAMTIQDVSDNNSNGSLTVFRPWMAAVKAAAMQAAGFYKDITHKYTSVSSATVPGGGFNYNINSNLEDGLNAGLLMLINDDAGFKWVSDQTTYSVDDNFVFNSLQAMYVLDIIMATSEQRMEKAFVGQSLADVSATTAVTVFKAICDDMVKLKLIAPSDDAPRGVKNIVIKIVNGNAMVVGCEIKEATSLKFVSIQFMVSAIQQSASG
jgi:hypothetical protein